MERGRKKIICLKIKINLKGNASVFLVVMTTKFLTIMHEIYYNYHIHLFFQQEIILGVMYSGNCYSTTEIFWLGEQESWRSKGKELRSTLELKEEIDRTGSILKVGLHLGPDCGLWAICPVSMETTYQLENQVPWMEGPQCSYLDSLLPKRIP